MWMSHCAKQICFVKRIKKKKKETPYVICFLCKITGCDRDRKHKKQYLYRLKNCNNNQSFVLCVGRVFEENDMHSPPTAPSPAVCGLYVCLYQCVRKQEEQMGPENKA